MMLTEDEIVKILENQFRLVEGVTRDWDNVTAPDTVYFYDVAKAIHQAELKKAVGE